MAKIKKLSKKITEEELLNLQGLVKAINSLQIDIGGLEVQKAQMLSGILNFRGDLQKNQLQLKEKYGDVHIDIADGSITMKKDGEINKKN
tara:strand:- start:2099 stop:2368 length:270 start_codon:yes stop_codon:yes gene_type:complete